MKAQATEDAAHTPHASNGAQLTARGLAMREKLLAAAAEVFAERGYMATSVQDILERTGASRGNFYWHFANKDEILAAALRPRLEALHQALRRDRSAGEQVTERSFSETITRYLMSYAEHRHFLCVMREAAACGTGSSFFATWMAERQRFIRRIADWLRRQDRLAPGVDPDLSAEALGAMIEQLAYVKIGLADTCPSPEEIEALSTQSASIWFRGVFGTNIAT